MFPDIALSCSRGNLARDGTSSRGRHTRNLRNMLIRDCKIAVDFNFLPVSGRGQTLTKLRCGSARAVAGGTEEESLDRSVVDVLKQQQKRIVHVKSEVDGRGRNRGVDGRGEKQGIEDRRNCTGDHINDMIMDVAEANSVRSPTRWTPLAVSTEAMVVLLVTALLVQLRFSYILPRVILILSRGVYFWLHKPGVDSKCPPGHEKTCEALDAVMPEIKNLDHESARRKTRSQYQSEILEILRIVPDKDVAGLKITENYEVNSRGIEIFSKSWLPVTAKPKACVCYCHGYGDTCTFFFEGIARKLASHNFAVFAMDYAGFGLSGGLHGYVQSFDLLVSDVTEHYSSLKEREEFKGLPVFLMGESMGGAVALKAHFSMQDAWDGAILVAPMCKILKLLARIIPKAKLVPSGDIAEIGFRDIEKRQQAMQNMIAYVGKPRLGTAVSLLNATHEIEGQLEKVSLPLLILHGAADRVTDPAVSQDLYKQASTPDKTLHLYENAWHAVLEGESDETVDKAIQDIVRWLDDHSSSQSTCRI